MSRNARRSRSSVLWPYETCRRARSHVWRAIAAVTHESIPPLRRATVRGAVFRVGDISVGDVSDPPRIGGPDIFMDLDLQSDRQSIGKDPLRQRTRVQQTMRRRQEHPATLVKPVVRNELPG